MRVNLRSAGTALAAGTMLMAVTAAPAAAAGKPSLAHAKIDVRAADRALVKLKVLASTDSPAAIKALAFGRADINAAAHQARWMHSTASASTSATAFADVAVQADRNVQAYASLLETTTGTLQTAVAEALAPVMAVRTEALGFLGELSANLPVSAATNATSTLTGVIGNGPAEIAAMNAAIGAGTSSSVQPLIAQAVVTAGGCLGTSISEVEGIVTELPATVQPIVEGELTGLLEALGGVNGSLQTTASTESSATCPASAVPRRRAPAVPRRPAPASPRRPAPGLPRRRALASTPASRRSLRSCSSISGSARRRSRQQKRSQTCRQDVDAPQPKSSAAGRP